MKTLLCLTVPLALFGLPLLAQDAKTPAPTPAATMQVKTNKVQLTQSAGSAAVTSSDISEIKKKEVPVSYGGFLVDLSKAQQPAQLISIRSPRDPKKDAENLYTDPETGKIKGIVFFAIRF